MNWPIRKVTKGGIPVTEAANGMGAPYVESDRGVPVTFVAKGGIPLTTGGGGPNLRRENSGDVTVVSLARTWTPKLSWAPNGSLVVSE